MVLFVVVLVVLGVTAGLGWYGGASSVRRRHRLWSRDVPPPAEVYEEGFRAGFAEALSTGAAHHPSRRGHDGAETGEGPAGPVTTPTGPDGHAAHPGTWDAGPERSAPTTTGGARQSPADPWISDEAGGEAAPTPEEAAAAKAQRDLRNINVALYSASLLLVAAGGLFISAAVPGPARAVTISAVVALFYLGGLALHVRLPRLRPAAVAFTGTGLALLPVAGLLFGVLTEQGRFAWFATALIGTIAYVLAAVRLQSRVVAHLTLPFFLSIALSSVSLLGGALVWYFTCSIAVAALLAAAGRVLPRLPAVLAGAVETHRFITPIVLVASVLLGGSLGDADRAVLWMVASAYHGASLATSAVGRVRNFYALRVVASVAVLLSAVALGANVWWTPVILALCLAPQVIALLAFPDRVRRLLTPSAGDLGRRAGDPRADGTVEAVGVGPAGRAASRLELDLVVSFSVLTLAGATAALPGLWSTRREFMTGYAPDPLIPMMLVLGVAIAAAVMRRGRFELLVVPAVLPGTVTRWDDPWRTEVILVLVAGYFVIRAVRAGGVLRERFALAARGAVVGVVPVALPAHAPRQWSSIDSVGLLALLGLVLILAANQLVEVLRVRRRAAPAYGAVVVCGASAAALVVAALVATGSRSDLAGAVALWICVASGVVTVLAHPVSAAPVPPEAPGASIAGGTDSSPRGGSEVPSVRAVVTARPSSTANVIAGRLIEAIAPAALITAALLGPGAGFGVRSYEAILGVSIVFGALMARRSTDGRRRGAYLLAAQVSFTALTALVSADLELTIHGVFVVVALGVALQEVVRVILRLRLREVGLQASSAWLSVAVLVALPLVYSAMTPAAPHRGVLTVHLALVTMVAALLFVAQRMSGAAYPALVGGAALIAVLCGVVDTAPEGWLAEAPLTESAGAVTAVLCAAALVGLRLRTDDRRSRMPAVVGAGLFGAEALMLSFGDGAGYDRVGVTALVAAVAFVVSRREGAPWLDVAGSVAVILSATALVENLLRGAVGLPGAGTFQLLLGAVLASAVLYALRAVLPDGREETARRGGVNGTASDGAAIKKRPAGDAAVPSDGAERLPTDGAALRTSTGGRARSLGVGQRRAFIIGVALGWTTLTAIVAMGPDRSAVAASLVLAVTALLATLEVPLRRRYAAREIAFLVVVAGAQRIVWLAVDGMTFFWVAQWWVVALGALALQSFLRRRGAGGERRLIAAAVVLSGTGLTTIVDGTPAAQIWALCGHILLLVAGVALSRRLFTLWGAIGIALALLWFLRGYTFLLLAAAALMLLAFAVWKLNTQTRGGAARERDGGNDRPDPSPELDPAPTVDAPPAGPAQTSGRSGRGTASAHAERIGPQEGDDRGSRLVPPS